MLRPKESTFFYCRYNELLDFAGEIYGEWACGRGETGFFVCEPRWGFEFIRHGDRLTEHLARFHTNGIYDEDIQSPTGWWLTAGLPCRGDSVHRYFSPLPFPFVSSVTRFTNPILQTPTSRNCSAQYSWRGTVRFFLIA
jgi:hypothetical protein